MPRHPLPIQVPVVAPFLIEIFKRNAERKLVDEEIAQRLRIKFPLSKTDFLPLVTFYRNRYNKGLLPTQSGKRVRLQLGRAVLFHGKRVLLPAGRRGPLLKIVKLHVDEAAAMTARLLDRKRRLEKRLAPKPPRRREKRKQYWVSPDGASTVRKIVCPDGWHLR